VGTLVKVWDTDDTNHIQQSRSWEANGHSANQEIPRLLWNPKVLFITMLTRALLGPGPV